MTSDRTEVPLRPLPLVRLRPEVRPEGWKRLAAAIGSARPLIGGRRIWLVNSTVVGGGVAEMLRSLVPYALGAGFDARWVVIGGSPPFFAVTKELHNQLHGHARRRLGEDAHAIYQATLAANTRTLASAVKPGDVVVLHDPQVGALVAPLRDAGATVVWAHIGTDRLTRVTRRAWDFLLPYIGPADAFVSSSERLVPPEVRDRRVHIIAPSIDPTGAKNSFMAATTVEAILHHTGLVRAGHPSRTPPGVVRGSAASWVRRRAQVVRYGPGPRLGVDLLVLHLARWDRLKDAVGVMRGFTRHVLSDLDAYLVVAGPAPGTVADDPEAEEMFQEVVRAWGTLPARKRSRVQLAVLPNEDPDESAAIVNALQRASTVVVKKSLEEGFGLGATEADVEASARRGESRRWPSGADRERSQRGIARRSEGPGSFRR